MKRNSDWAVLQLVLAGNIPRESKYGSVLLGFNWVHGDNMILSGIWMGIEAVSAGQPR